MADNIHRNNILV